MFSITWLLARLAIRQTDADWKVAGTMSHSGLSIVRNGY
jgi:hypothetical protein